MATFLACGQTSPHQVLAETWRATGWTPERLSDLTGTAVGFWGLPEGIERMLDALLVPHEARLHGVAG